jgi:hypothetical protein
MPPRIRKIQHDEDTRAKIKVGNIITRIQKFALAKPVEEITIDAGTPQIKTRFVDEDGNEVWAMTKEQVAVAKMLLDKALPNLTSVDVKQENTTTYVLRAPEQAKDATEWLKNYGPKVIEHDTVKALGKADGKAN